MNKSPVPFSKEAVTKGGKVRRSNMSDEEKEEHLRKMMEGQAKWRAKVKALLAEDAKNNPKK